MFAAIVTTVIAIALFVALWATERRATALINQEPGSRLRMMRTLLNTCTKCGEADSVVAHGIKGDSRLCGACYDEANPL